MTDWHLKSRRKKTGGIRKSKRRSDKKLAWKGGKPAITLLSKENEKKTVRARGGNQKTKLLKTNQAIVSENGKTKKAKILSVEQNPANRHFERREVITKGTILELEVNGKKKRARVTSRPGQSGGVQARIISKKTEKGKGKKEKKPKKKEPKQKKQEAKKTKK